MNALKILLQPDTAGAQSQLQIDAQNELDGLIAIIQPFAESYRLHKDEGRLVSNLKEVMAMDTSVADWKVAYVELYGENVHVSALPGGDGVVNGEVV